MQAVFVGAALVLLNLCAFILFGVDKSRAQRGAWRISERALLLSAACFGGTGALALEALSRGADFAALADRDREAVSCIRRNGEKLRFMDAMRIYAGDWRQALSQMKGEERRFDLVFLDPPYRMPVLEECCAALADLGLLEADALLVLEHRLDAVPSPDGRFALWKDRAYGDTAIHFFHYRESV